MARSLQALVIGGAEKGWPMGALPLGIEILGRHGPRSTRVLPARVHRRPMTVGFAGDVIVEARGVLDEHLLLFVKKGRLLVASTSAALPAWVDQGDEPTPVPVSWVALALPARVVLGSVVLRLFWSVPHAQSPRRRDPTPSQPTALVELTRPRPVVPYPISAPVLASTLAPVVARSTAPSAGSTEKSLVARVREAWRRFDAFMSYDPDAPASRARSSRDAR